MNQAYLNIKNTRTLEDVLSYLKTVKDKSRVMVFMDWDDTLVNPDYDTIIEPEATKRLFDYMHQNRIFYSIITGRFWTTSCDDTKRNLFDMQHNIIGTMFPSLKKLGVDTDKYTTDEFKRTIYKVHTTAGECVGILYMGIFFSGQKGKTIKNYIRQTGLDLDKVLFIDDYEPYLIETTTSFPQVTAYRRITPYHAVN